MLVGLVLCVPGFLGAHDPGGRVRLVSGMVLASLAGRDTAMREHVAAYRSHPKVGALPGMLVAAGLPVAGAPWAVLVPAAAALFAAAFARLRSDFRRRFGGLPFTVR